MTRNLKFNSNGYDRIVREILRLAKKGISKNDITEKFAISKPQARRITAELVSNGLLRYHDVARAYMTTAKGNLYIMKKRNKTKSILVAVDGSKSSLNAVDYAVQIARKEDNVRVILLNVLDISMAKEVASSIIIAPTVVLKEYELHKAEAKKWLNKINKKFEDYDIETIVDVVGGPLPVGSSIVNYAENAKVDLIVVGTRGLSGIKKLLLGSVASNVVTHSSSSVLIVK